MNRIIKSWKKHDFNSVYNQLKERNYDYTLEGLVKDFHKVDSMDKYCYLIYLIAREFSVENIILLGDFLIYLDTIFYDVHPVIYMLTKQAINMFSNDKKLLNWILDTYEGHPDSPYTLDEINMFKRSLND